MELPDAQVVLLDVEGTTTPVTFVYDVLFPYARDQLDRFLDAHAGEPEVAKAVDLLAEEHAQDAASGADPPGWSRDSPAVAAYCRWLMDADRKATGLKSLQGLIWKDGYGSGALKATLYDDVVPALERWKQRGVRICIYSSGSVLAQKLLFAHTDKGDVTAFLSGYFDTTTGPKMESASYVRIAAANASAPGEVLFLSDSVAEIDAAREAGMATGLVVRDVATALENARGHTVVETFAGIG